MLETSFHAGRLMMAGVPALLTSYLLFRADQPIFGLPSDFLGGFIAVVGAACLVTGVALWAHARRFRS